MTLLVDFNMMDREGRVLAVVEAHDRTSLKVGDAVQVVDDDGNRSRGTILKLRRAARGASHVAHVRLTLEAPGPAATRKVSRA